MKNKLKIFLPVAFLMMSSLAQADELTDLLGAPSSDKSVKKAAPVQNQQEFILRQIIGSPNSDQNIFIRFFASQKYDKALYTWWDAFQKTSFAATDNGKALYAYLLLKNNLPLTGLETLLTVEKPNKIHAALVQWWRAAVPATDPLWTHLDSKTDLAWESVFGVNAYMKDYALWEHTIRLGVNDDYKSAAQGLSVLMKSEAKAISEDLLNITAARFLFQNGYLEPATRYYLKVPKSSDYYFEAQEEAAWSQMRSGEPQNALAITKTLVNPQFAVEVGPETVYLHSLLNLKVCDYPEVIKTLKYFKTQYREKAENLLKITNDLETPAVLAYASRAKVKALHFKEVGSQLKLLPRYITRDRKLQQTLSAWNDLEAEAKVAGDIYAASLSGGTNLVGFQARYEYFKKSVEKRMQVARSASLNRVQKLAKTELKEISDILQKLHIVEAEVVQQISLSGRVMSATANKSVDVKLGQTAKSSDQMVFPFDGEVWFDELTNYSVDVKKGCQAAKL